MLLSRCLGTSGVTMPRRNASMRAMKWIDLPPVWLALAVFMAWWIAELQPASLRMGGPVFDLLGGILVGGGLVLMALAVVEMRKQNTTVIPHRDADHLITTGVFRRSRNPIYLGDALMLSGLALRWDAPVALTLVPLFVGTITQRFIVPEENRLRHKFRADFARYYQKTRRWL